MSQTNGPRLQNKVHEEHNVSMQRQKALNTLALAKKQEAEKMNKGYKYVPCGLKARILKKNE